jgi:hypothetical protein
MLDDYEERENCIYKNIELGSRDINNDRETSSRLSNVKLTEIEKLNLEIKDLFMLTISQYEEINVRVYI